MTKTDIIRQIQRDTGKGFLCLSEIADFMGQGRDKTRNMLKGVDYYREGDKGKKLYLASDVAECIIQRKQVD